ncbi:MAG: DUF1552 domain-containing protein, partial [Gammaproteobacteria bacterium]
MMIFKKAIPRRTFLRGAGATLALPLLDGMVPAFAATGDTAAKPAIRLGFVYVPNGIIMEKWTPATEGANFEITPTLAPLAPFKDQFVVVSGLDNKAAQPPPGERRAGPHASASGAFLTGVYPQPPAQAGISVDQIAATELGKHTQLASLELTLDNGEQGAGADAADTDAYLNTMSWRTASTPLPVENNPRRLFQRMFGEDGSTSPAERLRRIQEDRSILDSVTDSLSRLRSEFSGADRERLDDYTENVREIERRLEISAKATSTAPEDFAVPPGIPQSFDEHIKLMFDLLALAFQADITRVGTLLFARDLTGRRYPASEAPN